MLTIISKGILQQDTDSKDAYKVLNTPAYQVTNDYYLTL